MSGALVKRRALPILPLNLINRKGKRPSHRAIARARGRCEIQLAGCTVVATTAHHMVPDRNGGSNSQANLLAACWACHSWIHRHEGEAEELGLIDLDVDK